MSKATEAPVPALDPSPPVGNIPTIPEPEAPPEGEAPKRKRHRRTKAELEKARAKEAEKAKGEAGEAGGPNPEQVESCKVALSAFFEIGSKIVAKRRGPHWILEKEEAAALGEVWTNALAPYLGRIGAAMPFALAIAVTFGSIKPRLDQDAQLAEGPAATGPQPVP